MAPTPGTRSALPSTSKGLGIHFSSPRKARNPKKTQTFVNIPGRETKRQRLLTHLDDLLQKRPADAPAHNGGSIPEAATSAPESPVHDDAPLDYNFPDDVLDPPDTTPTSVSTATRASSNRYENWKKTIPTLIPLFLSYLSRTLGKPTSAPSNTPLSCCRGDCDVKKTQIIALYHDCEFVRIHAYPI